MSIREDFLLTVLFPRHRAVNLFLQGYEKSWIEAEEHYFEDKLIEDLAVSYLCKLAFKMTMFFIIDLSLFF